MKPAPIPENDEERIAALENYEIIDTAHEEEYDEITRLASAICQTPISLITFVDKSRQVFKAHFGFNADSNERLYGFCATAINTTEDCFIIPDTSKDDRFFDHPMVLGEPYIGFYAAVPLMNEEAYVLGTLCVMDRVPKTLSAYQLQSLKILGHQVIHMLELRKKNKQLQGVIALRELNNSLSKSNKDLNDFAYLAAHDMQEPLRMISSFSDLLGKQYDGLFDEKATLYFNFIKDGAKRMSLMISDLLEYSKLDGEKKLTMPVDIDGLLRNVIRDLNSRINYTHAEINIPVFNITLNTNPNLLYRLLLNLINNALKFVSPDKNPNINIGLFERENHWEFSVTDNGIGIPADSMEKLFRMFSRIHKEGYEGTGLGLAASKKIAEQLNGTIWVSSEVGVGSTFFFTIAKE